MNNTTRQRQSINEKGVHVPVYPLEKKDQMNTELLKEKLRPTNQQFSRSIKSGKNSSDDETPGGKSSRRKSYTPLSYDNLTEQQQLMKDLGVQSRFKRRRKNEHSKQIQNMLEDLKHGRVLSADPYENERLIREVDQIQRHETNMNMMDDILDASELEEHVLKNKVGGKAFTSVTVYERNLKRQKDAEKTQKLLERIKTRTRSTDLLGGTIDSPSKKNIFDHSAGEKHTSVKNAWLQESKNRARENMLSFTHFERIQENTLQEQMKHENELDELRHDIHHITNERDQLFKENKVLNHKIESLNETIDSLKYTREILRQKIGKVNAREMDNQQRLRIFEDFQPLFEDLRDHFKFDHPKEVINRMKMLEKKQTDSYKQLMDAQQHSNDLEREIVEMKKRNDAEIRERIKDLKAKLQITQMERDNFETAETSLRREIKDYKEYKDKYLSLHSAVMDMWTTFLQDVEQIGTRHSTALVEPDYANAFQVLEAVKNLVISFTPSKAGDVYIKFSQIANSYWKQYYSDHPNMKGKPQVIIKKIGETLEEKTKRISQLETELETLRREKKEFLQERAKMRRDKRALETELNLTAGKRRASATSLGPNAGLANSTFGSPTTPHKTASHRPQSASARLIGKHSKRSAYGTPMRSKSGQRPQSAVIRKRSARGLSINRSRPKTARNNHSRDAASFFITQTPSGDE